MPPESMQAIAGYAGLSLVSERSSEERKALPRHFQKNPSFQSLCADFLD